MYTYVLEIPVKLFSFEKITSAEQQAFWEMQSSEDQSEPVPPGMKPIAPVQQPSAQISKEAFSIYHRIAKASCISESCMKTII